MSVERPMGILQRTADMIEALADRGALSLAEIADQVHTPRSSVYRLQDALAEAGLTEQQPDARIRLAQRWLRLADAARSGMSEWAHARGILDDLAIATEQTVFLTVPRGHTSMCVDWARSTDISILMLKPGRSLPLYAGAAGRVTLAHGLDNPDDYLTGAPFPAFTHATLTTAAALRDDITTSRQQGYTLSDGDVTEGIGAIGTPLRRPRHGTFAGALSLGGLAESVREHSTELIDALLTAAENLEQTLP